MQAAENKGHAIKHTRYQYTYRTNESANSFNSYCLKHSLHLIFKHPCLKMLAFLVLFSYKCRTGLWYSDSKIQKSKY